MRHAINLVLLITNLFVFHQIQAQIIWSEDFSAGSAAQGTSAVGYPSSSGGNWTQTTNILGGGEGANANRWYVSGEECGNSATSCGSVCSNGDASLHISAIGGLCATPDCGAAYDATDATNITDKRIESPAINTTGYGGLTLSFNYIAAQDDDKVAVVYSCDGGSTWNNLPALNASQCCDCNDAFLCAFLGSCCGGITTCNGLGQGYWTNQNYSLPACAENISNLKIGFHWVNDGNGLGTDPSIAVDDITITSSTPLAVELLDFKGWQQKESILLDWMTATEKENAYFIIERRSAESDFEMIGKVSGAGNSNHEISYSFYDRQPNNGSNYYRLKMVDFNNNVSHSDVIYVPYVNTFELRAVYPNPAENMIHVQLNSKIESNGTITIKDNLGRVVGETKKIRVQKGIVTYDVDITTLNGGNYFIEVEVDGKYSSAAITKI